MRYRVRGSINASVPEREYGGMQQTVLPQTSLRQRGSEDEGKGEEP